MILGVKSGDLVTLSSLKLSLNELRKLLKIISIISLRNEKVVF